MDGQKKEFPKFKKKREDPTFFDPKKGKDKNFEDLPKDQKDWYR